MLPTNGQYIALLLVLLSIGCCAGAGLVQFGPGLLHQLADLFTWLASQAGSR